MPKIRYYIYSLFFALLVLPGCSRRPYFKESRLMMGTIVEITCQDKAAINSAFKEIESVERTADNFNPESEISKLNRAGEIKAGGDLFFLFNESLRYWRLSGGAFDITVMPLAGLWKKRIKDFLNNIESELFLPKDEEIKERMRLVGSEKIDIDQESSLIRFRQAGMAVDLGGIAKGYAVDKAVSRLRELGVKSAMVNAGGNIFCLGKKYNRKWRIGIRHPRKSRAILFTLDLEDQAVSTSGDYEQYFYYEGKRYGHIIDPKTGYPADNMIISVTVISDDAISADALSTAAFVLGKKKARELFDKIGNLQARIIEEKDIIIN